MASLIQEVFMSNLKEYLGDNSVLELTPEVKKFLKRTESALKGSARRIFMAETVELLGKGGQRKAQREPGWDRDTIRKGSRELKSGITCIDNFKARGRKPIGYHLPNIKNLDSHKFSKNL